MKRAMMSNSKIAFGRGTKPNIEYSKMRVYGMHEFHLNIVHFEHTIRKKEVLVRTSFFSYRTLNLKHPSVHRATYNVKQFGCDGLLARLVVCQCQLAEQIIGIVCGHLHGHHTGGMLAGQAVEKRSINLEMQ